ncbi:GNAT family N-acetyltransferase [Pseudoalteromonas xiamenensis]|uniref:GNAT family N-acetyltransferase n=1 Tax=Pseudoalteromonas xiamenensis TaxID=882626 RepID=UPI0027E3C539|nr:GNAT family N-acetyltransferase [Pseudoalteromonas xiamenensis]WMN59429.1 GNAT family N-acetyltransferase [Pseudoalteromonas xiamenensis]
MRYIIEAVANLDAKLIERLTVLLVDCVNQGASLGFYRPAQTERVVNYWHATRKQLENKDKQLFIAFDEQNNVAGTVQLNLCQKQNGCHRGEVEKLLVDPTFQRSGIATLLMSALEAWARQYGIKLLYLDTQTGDKSESFYRAREYLLSGTIPSFVTDAQGRLHSTSVYYKELR